MRPPTIVYTSNAMQAVIARADKLAPSDCPVLILGESGTGKGLVAEILHCRSARTKEPFVRVNCAEHEDALLRSEIFGHERGAFSGAEARKIGLAETAHNGTLFLDEVTEMSKPAQAKLLHLLEEKTLRRVGGVEPISVDIRVISATNKNPEELIEQSKFRQDLYYRLNGGTIVVPPLRDRMEDLSPLVRYFLKQYNKAHKTSYRLTPTALSVLMHYQWPGNVRELRHCIRAAIQLADSPSIDAAHILDVLNAKDNKEIMPFDAMMRRHLVKILMFTHWRLAEAGELLVDHPTTIRRKLDSFDVSREIREILGEDLDAILEEPKALLVQALRQAQWQKSAAAKALRITPYRLSRLMEKWNLT